MQCHATNSNSAHSLLIIIGCTTLLQVEAISMYNSMKENLMEYLAKFAQNGKVVREEDIKQFFEVTCSVINLVQFCSVLKSTMLSLFLPCYLLMVNLNAVFRIRILLIRIRIQHFRLTTDQDPGFWWAKIGKNLQQKKKFLFLLKNYNLSIPRPPERTSKLPKSPQSSKENIQHFKTWNVTFFWFVGHFCPPGSGFRIRIRIHGSDWIRIRIQNTG